LSTSTKTPNHASEVLCFLTLNLVTFFIGFHLYLFTLHYFINHVLCFISVQVSLKTRKNTDLFKHYTPKWAAKAVTSL